MDTHWISYKQSGGTTLPEPKLYKVHSPVLSGGGVMGIGVESEQRDPTG